MGTYKHTGVGDAAALQNYATANQIIDGALTYLGTSTTGNDTYVVSAAISPGALVNGAVYTFKPDTANTGACSIAISGIAAIDFKLQDGTDPHDNAIIANQTVSFAYDGTNAVLLNPEIGSSNIVLEAGSGIDFSATSDGSGTLGSELFDDYEEGTWTPTLTCLTSGTITLSASPMLYTKIGRVVYVSGYMLVSSVSSPLGGLQLNGLPFTSGTGVEFSSAITVSGDSFIGSGAATQIVGSINNAATTAGIDEFEAGQRNQTLAGDVQANTNFVISGFYTV